MQPERWDLRLTRRKFGPFTWGLVTFVIAFTLAMLVVLFTGG